VWSGPDGSSELRFVPRAVWWGLEWSRYALHQLWELPPGSAPLLRGVNVKSMFDEQLNCIPKKLHKRLKYYRPYVAEGLTDLRLHGYYAQTALDGNKVHQPLCMPRSLPPLSMVPLSFALRGRALPATVPFPF
jgi:hypothetical protein